MGFSEAVAWWDEWQVRVLALASLFLQCFLLVAAPRRKRGIPPWFRFLTWLAYLGSDAVAIYALAALFNRRRKLEWVSSHRSSASLQALWAPILLLHLGGQDSMTAYNLEDNELWKRHVLTALSQITIAIYVFRKSWYGDKRLLQAAILVFVPGILKCLEKPWALYRASINSMADSLRSSVKNNKYTDGVISVTEYVKSAAEYVKKQSRGAKKSEPASAGNVDGEPVSEDYGKEEEEVNLEPYKLFVDLSYSYHRRLQDLRYMVQIPNQEAHRKVHTGLSNTFERLYTKRLVYSKTRGCMVRVAVLYLPFVAIWLFHKSRREDYNRTDVRITYVLLCGTAALALDVILVRLKISRPRRGRSCGGQPPVSGDPEDHRILWEPEVEEPPQVRQCNLIGYTVTRNHWHIRTLMGLASRLHWEDQLGRVLVTAPPESSKGITERIHIYVTKGWMTYIKDADTYRSFNDNRGDWILKRTKEFKNQQWSLRRPFDESVLLWHLATDFCYHNEQEAWPPACETVAGRCRIMSNYMAYLLFVNPEMLIPGARHGIFTTAYYTLHDMLISNNEADRKSPTTEADEPATTKILRMLKQSKAKKSDSIHDAWALACELMELGEKKKERMWVVIQGVWVEMLCFSAGRCRGYLHAKSLGNGGEYLSYVWLLLSYMGMETMADRLRRTKLTEGGDIDADVVPPASSSAAPAGPSSAPAPGSSESATAATNTDENI